MPRKVIDTPSKVRAVCFRQNPGEGGDLAAGVSRIPHSRSSTSKPAVDKHRRQNHYPVRAQHRALTDGSAIASNRLFSGAARRTGESPSFRVAS